jgi:hypothetical protein
MSQYIDCNSRILYGTNGSSSQQSGAGRKTQTHYNVGQHPNNTFHALHRRTHKQGGNAPPQYPYARTLGNTFDYPYLPPVVPPMYQYGGGSMHTKIIGGMSNNVRGIPPRYSNSTPYELGNNYEGGYTKSLNTYIGGRKRRHPRKIGGYIVQ